MRRLAVATGKATYAGDSVAALGEADQLRSATDEPGVSSAAGESEYADPAGDLVSIVKSPFRWVGARIKLDGIPLQRGGVKGKLTWSRALDQHPDQFNFEVVGPLYGIPSKSADLKPPNGDPTQTPPPTTRVPAPRTWGNRRVECIATFAASPASPQEVKVFSGYSFQCESDGDVAMTGSIKCLDNGFALSRTPVCFEIQPFSGLTRGAIFRLVWQAMGQSLDDLETPEGSVVNKYIQLNNVIWEDFVADFGKPDSFFGRWDDATGHYVIRKLELKDTPDWVMSAAANDFDADSFRELPPSLPPTEIFATAKYPKPNKAAGGQDLVVRTVTTEELDGLYSAQCRKSFAGAHLYGDGSYRVDSAFKLQPIQRVVTTIETTNGQVTLNDRQVFGWKSALAFDPNFNTFPAGTNYDDAYGDKTFHADPQESFQEIQRDTVTQQYDANGTLLHVRAATKGFGVIKSSARFSSDRSQLVNAVGHYVFPGGIVCVEPQETYRETGAVDTTWTYNADGTLDEKVEDTWAFDAPESRCSIFTTTTVPDSGTAGSSSTVDPSGTAGTQPPPPPPPPAFVPVVSAGARAVGLGGISVVAVPISITFASNANAIELAIVPGLDFKSAGSVSDSGLSVLADAAVIRFYYPTNTQLATPVTFTPSPLQPNYLVIMGLRNEVVGVPDAYPDQPDFWFRVQLTDTVTGLAFLSQKFIVPGVFSVHLQNNDNGLGGIIAAGKTGWGVPQFYPPEDVLP